MSAPSSRKKYLSVNADKARSVGAQASVAVLTDTESRADVLNRLRRAEGQLRGIQRMIEEGESCLKVGQQFSAVRKALDSTYLRMTVCFMAQELESRLTPDEDQRADLAAMMKDMETLLARMG